MRIATAQNQIQANIELNFSQIKALVIKAAKEGTDFIHFPEGALSGYAKAQIKDWAEVDWEELEMKLDDICTLCATYQIGTAIGCAYKHQRMNRPFNSLYIIDKKGNLIARYDKRFCSHTEINDWYHAGEVAVVVDIEGIRLGFALCIEIQFPEIFMEYERMGVDCVLLSAYSKSEMFRIQAQGHAACNCFWISYSVPTNTSYKQASCLIGPDGSVLSTCKNGISDLVMHNIDPNAAEWDIPYNKARPWRKLARSRNIYSSS